MICDSRLVFIVLQNILYDTTSNPFAHAHAPALSGSIRYDADVEFGILLSTTKNAGCCSMPRISNTY